MLACDFNISLKKYWLWAVANFKSGVSLQEIGPHPILQVGGLLEVLTKLAPVENETDYLYLSLRPIVIRTNLDYQERASDQPRRSSCTGEKMRQEITLRRKIEKNSDPFRQLRKKSSNCRFGLCLCLSDVGSSCWGLRHLLVAKARVRIEPFLFCVL